MKYLLIGASGLLGRHLTFDVETLRPTSKELDITNIESVARYFLDNPVSTVILSAAYTNSGNSNNEKELVSKINISGVRNILEGLDIYIPKSRLVYISSDYVFKGDKGHYKTTDITDPAPNNYYAYSKAVAEEIVKTYKKHLIIRTSFCSNIWPYDNALCDKFTSADKVTTIAPMIADAIQSVNCGILHVGTKRKSTYDLAKTINPNVKQSTRSMFPNYSITYDTSMEISKW